MFTFTNVLKFKKNLHHWCSRQGSTISLVYCLFPCQELDTVLSENWLFLWTNTVAYLFGMPVTKNEHKRNKTFFSFSLSIQIQLSLLFVHKIDVNASKLFFFINDIPYEIPRMFVSGNYFFVWLGSTLRVRYHNIQ